IMQLFCWHVAVKMSLGFLCLFLVFSTVTESCLVSQKGKLLLNLFLHFTASCTRREKREKQVAVLATAELPAKSLDLAAINLTELVNNMLNTALKGTKKLFSLLSVTSYSSFAFHKVSVTIYNISNVKNVDPGKFPVHYCYCLNNVTNDLTDFTALLVDIIGNSTSYLTEIFKSSSILSVRQSNDSDCIYICVMTGQTAKGRNLSDFWEMLEKSPVVNYTFSSNTSSDLGKYILENKGNSNDNGNLIQEDSNKTLTPSTGHEWTSKRDYALQVRHFTYAQPNLLLVTGTENSVDNCTAATFSEHLGSSKPIDACEWDSHIMQNVPSHRLVSQYVFRAPAWCLQGCPSLSREVAQGRHPCGGIAVCTQHVCACSSPGSGVTACRAGGFTAVTQNLYISLLICMLLMPQIRHCKKINGTSISASSKLHFSLGCPQAILKESHVTSPPVTLIVQKINPCVMELCRFFQLCLCVGQRRHSRKEAMRYCVEYYSWFLKNASYVCERVKRVAYSYTLKQKCLKSICMSL
ncbi:HHLA1 protein, partial [Psilopogon haemacephalus]|nr:HHLA1 protein [Psilopogon haemacephalus]